MRSLNCIGQELERRKGEEGRKLSTVYCVGYRQLSQLSITIN